MIEKGQHVLVGVSGGADSVALFYALHFLSKQIGFQFSVAHLHHGTRGAESDGDMQFVRELAQCLGVPCYSRIVDVPKRAKRTRRSLEMEARFARHSFFFDLVQRNRFNSVVLAHTADDQAETFLLKLGRGAGLRGLAGMSSVKKINGCLMVRPMLKITRPEIEDFLNSFGLVWREDASNKDMHYRRNRVRHEIIPCLEEKLNPKFCQSLLRTMDVLREEDDWISRIAESYLKSVSSPTGDVIFGDRLSIYPAAARRRVIMNWLLKNGVPSRYVDFEHINQVDDLLLHQDGSRYIQITDQARVVNQYGKLRVSQIKRSETFDFEAKLDIGGVTWVPRCQVEVKVVAACGIIKDTSINMGEYPACASIDFARADGKTLIVRSIRDGDRMRPLGMKGTRKLQDILVDEKVPRELRRDLPVVECDGEIVWLPGYRISEDWKVRGRQGSSIQITMTKTIDSAENVPIPSRRREREDA